MLIGGEKLCGAYGCEGLAKKVTDKHGGEGGIVSSRLKAICHPCGTTPRASGLAVLGPSNPERGLTHLTNKYKSRPGLDRLLYLAERAGFEPALGY